MAQYVTVIHSRCRKYFFPYQVASNFLLLQKLRQYQYNDFVMCGGSSHSRALVQFFSRSSELRLWQNGTNWIFVVRRCGQSEAEKPIATKNVRETAVAMIYYVSLSLAFVGTLNSCSEHADGSGGGVAERRCKYFSSRRKCKRTQQEQRKVSSQRFFFLPIHGGIGIRYLHESISISYFISFSESAHSARPIYWKVSTAGCTYTQATGTYCCAKCEGVEMA